MAEKKMGLRVITPWETKVDEEVGMVIFRSVAGEMGVLPQHEPYLCALDYGAVRILSDGIERRMAVLGGICEIKDNVLTVLTDDAHWPDEIDREREEERRLRIEQSLQEQTEGRERRDWQAKLRQVLVKLEVSNFPMRGRELP